VPGAGAQDAGAAEPDAGAGITEVVGGDAAWPEEHPPASANAATAATAALLITSPKVRTRWFASPPVAVRGGLTLPIGATIGGVGAHIVVVEDDPGIGGSLARTLEGQGFEVSWQTTGAGGFAAVRATTSLVILDLGLPDQDGLELCRRLRAGSGGTQVLILTARGEEADVVLGLDAGADDYLVKPFRLAELLARVRACTRRVEGDRDHLVIGDLAIDIDSHSVTIAGETVDLRPKEFDLLVALARNAGRVMTRERLLEEVWDEHWFGPTKTLDIHIWALRRKLDPTGGASRISTVRGVGYRVDLP